jgi:hypothetical protein
MHPNGRDISAALDDVRSAYVGEQQPFYLLALDENPRHVAKVLAGTIGLTLADLESEPAVLAQWPAEQEGG